jgi:hypothetical protein
MRHELTKIYNSVTGFALVPDELSPSKIYKTFPNAHPSINPTAQNRHDDTRSGLLPSRNPDWRDGGRDTLRGCRGKEETT